MAELGVELITAIGQMLLQALMNALTNTLTQIFTNAITGVLNNIAQSVSALKGIPDFLRSGLTMFLNNLTTQLNSTVATFLNQTNQTLQTAYGIINAQQKLHDILTGQVQKTVDSLARALNLEEQRVERTGAAISALVIGLTSQEPKMAETFITRFLDNMAAWGDTRAEYFRQNAHIALDYFRDYIAADIRRVEEMSNEEVGAAADAILAVAQERSRFIYDWFMQAVVQPISYQQAYTYMLMEALSLDKEAIKEHMRATQEAYDEWIREQLQAMLRQAGGGG
jgi:tRNA nucleotidyltransferase (CCA-adding enzyme)